MINLQAQGYKIIGSNILQSMLKCKLQIRENVNKRIRRCETLVLFCFSCKKDIYSFNTSPQVEKEKKKWMMDINLRYVAAVTSVRGDLTFLNHLLNIHTKVISSILRKNEHRLKRKIALDMCKNGWALHYVVIKINDGVQFYLTAKVLAVRSFNRLNHRLYKQQWVCYPQYRVTTRH